MHLALNVIRLFNYLHAGIFICCACWTTRVGMWGVCVCVFALWGIQFALSVMCACVCVRWVCGQRCSKIFTFKLPYQSSRTSRTARFALYANVCMCAIILTCGCVCVECTVMNVTRGSIRLLKSESYNRWISLLFAYTHDYILGITHICVCVYGVRYHTTTTTTINRIEKLAVHHHEGARTRGAGGAEANRSLFACVGPL